MPNIIFSKDLKNIHGQWLIKPNFKFKEHEFIHTDGRRYVLVAKYKQEYSGLERIGRVFLGAVITLVTLSAAYWCSKSVKRLLTKSHKSFVLSVLRKEPEKAPSGNKKDDSKKPDSSIAPDSGQPTPGEPTGSTAPAPSDSASTSSTPTPEASNDEAPEIVKSYFQAADSWSFLDSFLDEYAKAVNSADPKWNSYKAQSFLAGELRGIIGEIDRLEKEAHSLVQEAILKKHKSEENVKAIQELEKSASRVRTKHGELLAKLQDKVNVKPEKHEVIGFENNGNTCYINSALQPLLALGFFPALIPDSITQDPLETEKDFLGRCMILSSLRDFITAWNEKQSPGVLGRLVGALRSDIFQAGLQEGGFVDQTQERSYQDAGSFFELILHVIGRRFLLKESKIPYVSEGVVAKNISADVTPQAIYTLKHPGTVQEAVNALKTPERQLGDEKNEWRVVDPTTGNHVPVAYHIETNKIMGRPPEFLVVQFWPQRVVNPITDGAVDFSPLFEENMTPDQARYELVGFSQNHGQYHWTSVVRDGEGWKYCNDSSVYSIEPDSATFTHPARYLVYRKKA